MVKLDSIDLDNSELSDVEWQGQHFFAPRPVGDLNDRANSAVVRISVGAFRKLNFEVPLG